MDGLHFFLTSNNFEFEILWKSQTDMPTANCQMSNANCQLIQNTWKVKVGFFADKAELSFANCQLPVAKCQFTNWESESRA